MLLNKLWKNMHNVLFLQSWYSQITDYWYPWLKTELKKKGYKTYFPDLPEMRSDQPKMIKLLSKLETMGVFGQDTTIVGHSLGTLLAMRLAEKYQLKQLVLVSGWDFDDLTEGHKLFWGNKIDHSAIKRNVEKIYVVHSDNDPYITAVQAEDMCKRLNGEFLLIRNLGHFTKIDKLPQLLNLF